MPAPMRHFTAADASGRVFTVNIERHFPYEPYRDFLVCTHCDWSPSLLTTRRIDDMAAEHLATAHGAGGAMTQYEDSSLRTLRWIVLPVVAVFLVVLLFLAGK
ncbi:hypothetical protein [uncultured Streptomyces sp.]|uniref:hypothetical protein n=1 Tax=uncultured Streptomyces sp. TaxID=174707 RepID=UPI002624931B|nr:hypothetical protein [uncultured Streptomyces sp.]